jgi:hypothetical protein
MRSLRSFQLPGIDMLCDWREYSTAKQAQSVAHQNGAPGVLSELYGVTGWHFDFRGHKLQGDWQAALGVTVRVPHLAWLSMRGEAKRDYPASINYQSPWYREYHIVEDHFARLNTALTRGKPAVRVAVIHPIESYWLSWGPSEQTSSTRDELESNFSNIVAWLLFGLIDFDFLAESLLSESASVSKAEGVLPALFRSGKMAYEAVVVPPCRTLRSTTIRLLEEFAAAGGRIVFFGEAASLVDAQPSEAPRRLAAQGGNVSLAPFSRARALTELAAFRDIELRREDGSPHDNVFCQMRIDGERRWLFLCHVRRPANPDLPIEERSTLRVRGAWSISLWDSADGSYRPAQARLSLDPATGAATTTLICVWYAHDSLLLALEPLPTTERAAASGDDQAPLMTHACAILAAERSSRLLAGPVEVSLSEPNVLLLDMAEYRIADGPWQPREELLRIDNIARRRCGWASRETAMIQPWLDKGETERDPIALRFRIEADHDLEGCRLALERPSDCSISLNGEKVANSPDGWFVDEDIETLPLPRIPAGLSVLELVTTISPRDGLEWLYLLGDFGVSVWGSRSRITSAVERLDFGDWTRMGLPFYAGNVTYRLPIDGGARLALQAAQFRAPLLSIAVDGHRVGTISYSPYVVELGELGPGPHEMELTAFGNRANAFGPLHNCDDAYSWFGPDSWRTRDHQWSYEYRLRPMGVLVAPRLIEHGKGKGNT